MDFIKIDTEGQDCEIVESILEFYEEQKSGSPYQKPNRIQFETNDHLKKKRVDEIVKKFEKAGYETLYRGWDTILQIKRDEKGAYYQRTEEK